MGISSAVKKPQAQLQFHRSQRRRRTCDWRSCVMSKILFDVHELAHGHVFPRNRRAFCSCLDSYLSAQELENGRLAMFAFSGIVTQVAQWSEMWVVFSKAKTTKSSSLSLSLFKHGWVSSSIPIHKTTSYLFSFELFGTQNLLLMTYYEATCIVVWRQGLGCNAVHFLCRSIAQVSTGRVSWKLLQFAASCYKHSCWTTIVRPPLVFGFSVFGQKKAKNNPSHSPL